jgi:hypothetical protein
MIAHGLDPPGQIAALDRRGAHPQVVDHLWRDAKPGTGSYRSSSLIGIDRDVIHAHVILGRACRKRWSGFIGWRYLTGLRSSRRGDRWNGRSRRCGAAVRVAEMGSDTGLQAGRQQDAGAEQQDGGNDRQKWFSSKGSLKKSRECGVEAALLAKTRRQVGALETQDAGTLRRRWADRFQRRGTGSVDRHPTNPAATANQ